MLVALADNVVAKATDVWPSSKSIRVVVPAGAGQGADLIARLVFERLSLALGQSLIIDNKPGASGSIGAAAVARSAPDGFTLLFSTASLTVMTQALKSNLPYDVLKDLVPIVQIGSAGVALVVAPNFPARDLREFVQFIRSQPDRFSYASWGTGTTGHLTMEYLKSKTGMRINHVPYKSTGQIQSDLIGGTLQVGWSDMSSALSLIQAKRIRALAVSGSARFPASPDVRTMTEQGFPFDTNGWYGLFAPTGTPPEVINRINAEINRIIESPNVKEQFLRLNLPNVKANSHFQFKEIVERDLATWSSIVRENKIVVD